MDIKGYRQLSALDIELINEGKELAEKVGEYVRQLEETAAQLGLDKRWLAIGKTTLQQGFMALTRGIAQPTTF